MKLPLIILKFYMYSVAAIVLVNVIYVMGYRDALDLF